MMPMVESDLTSRWNATGDSLVGGLGTAISAWNAGERNRILGQEITEEAEISYQDIAIEAKGGELREWMYFEVFKPFKDGWPPKSVVDTRWVLTWEMVDGNKGVEARLVAKGNRGPDLKDGHLWMCQSSPISPPGHPPGGPKTWHISSLGIKNAFLQADGFVREVFPRVPTKWDPNGDN